MKTTFAIILFSSALLACDDGAAPSPAPDIELGDTVPASSVCSSRAWGIMVRIAAIASAIARA